MDNRMAYFNEHKDKLEGFLETVPDNISTSLFLRRFRDRVTSKEVVKESGYSHIVAIDAMSNRFYKFVNYCGEPFHAKKSSPIRQVYLTYSNLYDAYLDWESKYTELFDLYIRKLLSMIEIAEVMGISCNNVANLKSTMDKSFERYVYNIDISSYIDDCAHVEFYRDLGINTILGLIKYQPSEVDFDTLDIERLGFSIDTYNRLKRSGVNTLSDVFNTKLCGGTVEVIQGKWQNSEDTNKVLDVLRSLNE